MNIYAQYEERVREAVVELAKEGAIPMAPDLSRIVVEPPRDAAMGDLATNAALVLAKDVGMKPRDLAERILSKLVGKPGIAATSIAGPGFINLSLEPGVWQDVTHAILLDPAGFGRSTLGGGARINVEYVSANPTGPMHVGHCRGAVVGDALASLLAAAGWNVTREYYVNDAGAQVDVLARSAYLRYRGALGESISIPEGLYPGDYLKPVGEALKQQHGATLLQADEVIWLPLCRDCAITMMMAMIRDDLALLGVVQSVFFSERSLQQPVDQVGATIEALRSAGHIYEGTLAKPKGDAEDWEPREQTLFRATAFGDDVDRPLKKSDGSYTYFASDIAYHRNKFDRGFAEMIDVWGADHGGYCKRMQAAVKAATDGKGTLDIKLCQLVKLMRAGEPVKMSKRSGTFVTLREVVEEVGADAVRFIMLMRKNDAPLDFDLAKVIEQSKDNEVFYVQYAHARCRSVLRQAIEVLGPGFIPEITEKPDLSALTDPSELAILRRLAQYPRVIQQAAVAHEPHRVAFYLYDLAGDFHGHWNRGKDMPHLRFIRDDDGWSTRARLAMVQALASVLSSGLHLLGVSAPDEMR